MTVRGAAYPVSTFSIVGVDPASGTAGIAVASKFLAAGAVVPWASADAGAVATQSFANASFGPRGLALMRDGASATEALAALLADDGDRDKRQVGLVDMRGGSASHTGSNCFSWAGHTVGPNFAAQGNILTGEETVQAMAQSFRSEGGPLSERLLAALRAGDAAGGDRRGRQAAALYVVRDEAGYLGFNDVMVDLRVDDHADPLNELVRLSELQTLYFGSTPKEDKVPIAGDLLSELKEIVKVFGYFHGVVDTTWDEATVKALDAFINSENLEERVDLKARTIDPPAIAYMRDRFAGG